MIGFEDEGERLKEPVHLATALIKPGDFRRAPFVPVRLFLRYLETAFGAASSGIPIKLHNDDNRTLQIIAYQPVRYGKHHNLYRPRLEVCEDNERCNKGDPLFVDFGVGNTNEPQPLSPSSKDRSLPFVLKALTTARPEAVSDRLFETERLAYLGSALVTGIAMIGQDERRNYSHYEFEMVPEPDAIFIEEHMQ